MSGSHALGIIRDMLKYDVPEVTCHGWFAKVPDSSLATRLLIPLQVTSLQTCGKVFKRWPALKFHLISVCLVLLRRTVKGGN